MQVSGREGTQVQDSRVQMLLTLEAPTYFWLTVLVLGLVVPSAGCVTSDKPLSLGYFMSRDPCQL